MQVGDFVLVDNNRLVSKLIRFGQGIRFRGDQRPFARWNHVALIISDQGELLEALTKGVCRSHIDKYKDADILLVETHTSPEDQKQIMRFVKFSEGEKYSFLKIASIFLGVLTGGKFSIGYSGHQICSGLVAAAQLRSGAVFDRNAEDIMPADLARYYAIDPTTTASSTNG